jgi:hypothetical protein
MQFTAAVGVKERFTDRSRDNRLLAFRRRRCINTVVAFDIRQIDAMIPDISGIGDSSHAKFLCKITKQLLVFRGKLSPAASDK